MKFHGPDIYTEYGTRKIQRRGKRLRSKSVTRHRISARVATGKYYAAGWGEGRDKDGKSRRGRQSSEKLGCTNILYPWPCIHLCTENASLSFSFSLWFLAVSSRALFFFSHPLSSTSFLSAQPWENHIFPFSVSVLSFYPGRKMAFDVFLFFAFFFLFFCGKRVLFICWKETGFLVGWSRVLLDRLDESFVVYSTSFRCFSLLLVPTKRAKNSSTFTFHPFSFISITPITVTRCMKERIYFE